ncbi:MAG: CDP-alcohol phosphatidyltransferase family protein, partial [Actinobacteria bacterium]|nr:CDP-alcohol phosphatidyltransferase family protein [Actinomycetota bacterium]
MPLRRATGEKAPIQGQSSQPLTTILTLPNVISILRLLLIPIFFVLLVSDLSPFYAFTVYSVAAATDWIDGQVARRTNTVSKFGQVLDPFIDRLLIASGLIGIFIMHRIPLWIVVLLISRDIVLLTGTLYFNIKTHGENVPVIYLGKVT